MKSAGAGVLVMAETLARRCPEHCRSVRSAPLLVVQGLALLAERLTSWTVAAALLLNVPAGIAIRVVVMHGLSDGMPGWLFHESSPQNRVPVAASLVVPAIPNEPSRNWLFPR